MKKISLIFIFIFLTGLFSGLFFSTNLSEENSSFLSSALISGLESPSAGFFRTFLSSLTANLISVLIMLPAIFSSALCLLPPAVLWFRSFATGFCCGLIFISAESRAFTLSALEILPQSLLLIPGFFLMSAALFCWSRNDHIKKSRLFAERKNLLRIFIISLGLIFAGSLIQGVCHSAAL